MKDLAQHPFALRAARIADEAGDTSTARVLEEMLSIMHDVEDRFPGVPFSDVLADPANTSGYERARVRRTLTRTGACPADIDLVCPRSGDPSMDNLRSQLKTDPYSDKAHRL